LMQKNFSRTLQYNNRALTAEILADMDQLEALDKVYEFKERASVVENDTKRLRFLV
jgi:hypothetical protein